MLRREVALLRGAPLSRRYESGVGYLLFFSGSWDKSKWTIEHRLLRDRRLLFCVVDLCREDKSELRFLQPPIVSQLPTSEERIILTFYKRQGSSLGKVQILCFVFCSWKEYMRHRVCYRRGNLWKRLLKCLSYPKLGISNGFLRVSVSMGLGTNKIKAF